MMVQVFYIEFQFQPGEDLYLASGSACSWSPFFAPEVTNNRANAGAIS